MIGADGRGLVNLTRNPNVYAGHPSWSPDGTRLVFDCLPRNGPDYEIQVINANGTDWRHLTNDPANDWLPAWSPDGRRIAFTSDRNGCPWDIWVMDADGNNPVALTFGPAIDQHPTWSPDSRQIAFQSYRDGHEEMYAVNLNGGDLTRLADSNGNDPAPTWAP